MKRLVIPTLILPVLAVLTWLAAASDRPSSATTPVETPLTAETPPTNQNPPLPIPAEADVPETAAAPEDTAPFPMSIAALRAGVYPGGDFAIERTLPNGTNYRQYIASYRSEGLLIFGLLTVPTAVRPEKGFPAVLFIHGYIPPKQYSTTGNYPSYQARLARGGFVTFKPDLRGHGNSEGEAVSAHFSEKYTVDTLNALAYLKEYEAVDPERIGYWGHSNGGEIGLRVLVVSPDIKAASLWAGVVGSYVDMFETYNDKIDFLKDAASSALVLENGLPSANPDFWDTLDPYAHLADIGAPVELQHGTADKSVPIELSRRLRDELERAGKDVVMHEYPGDDHNIGRNAAGAWTRTIDFFATNLQ